MQDLIITGHAEPGAATGHSTNNVDIWQEIQAIQAEAIGWQHLDDGAYLHTRARHGDGDDAVIEVVGIPDASMQGSNVLWLF